MTEPGSAAGVPRGLEQRLALGAAASLAIQVGAVVLGFLLQLLLARTLGAGSYGIFAYAFAWLNIGVLVGTFGLDQASVRYLSGFAASGDHRAFAAFRRYARRLATGICTILVLTASALLAVTWNRLKPELAVTFAVAIAVLPLTVPLELKAATARALKNIPLADGPRLGLRPALFLLFAGMFAWLAPLQPTAAHMMGLYAAASLFVLITATLLVRSIVPLANQAGSPPAHDTGRWLRSAATLAMAATFSLVLGQTDVLLLGTLRNTHEAGLYAAATRLATFVPFGLNVALAIGAPVAAEVYARGDRLALQRTATWLATAGLLFALPPVLAFFVYSQPLLGLFGAEFVAAGRVLQILTVGQTINVASGPVGYLLMMTGHERQAAAVMGGSALLNFVLNAAFIWQWGMIGAAVATAVSMAVWNLTMLSLVYKHLGVNATVLPWRPRSGGS